MIPLRKNFILLAVPAKMKMKNYLKKKIKLKY